VNDPDTVVLLTGITNPMREAVPTATVSSPTPIRALDPV